MKTNKSYNVTIIGGGISGLVCGCYLAKWGFKTLIVEKNITPGGCCGSFTRHGYTFDFGAFSIGDCGKNGNFGRIISDLNLNKYIHLHKVTPSDIIITPHHKISIRGGKNKIIKEFRRYFKSPTERIEDFMNYLATTSSSSLFLSLKDSSFDDLLNIYFKNKDIKLIFKTIIVTFGEPSSKTSAVIAAIVLKEFILDGGYYPKGGMQSLSNGLAKCFTDNGGHIIFSRTVKKVTINKGKVTGIILENGDIIRSRDVVSSIDTTMLYDDLIHRKHLDKDIIKNVRKMKPSVSTFMVFLGLKQKIRFSSKACKFWCSLTENIDHSLSKEKNNNLSPFGDHFLISIPSSHEAKLAPRHTDCICLLASVPFINKSFWTKRKISHQINRLMMKASHLFPFLSKDNIMITERATPLTYQHYTNNRNGASYGWAGTIPLVTKYSLNPITDIKGLLLTGHWTKYGFGISRAALSGHVTASFIQNKYHKSNNT